MVTKGIIEEIIDTYKAKVRLPVFDALEGTQSGISNNNLCVATNIVIANMTNPVSVGDVVFVTFEDNDNSKPIILGHLYKQKLSATKPNLSLGGLEATGTIKLSKFTSIGDVSYKEIQALIGINANIKDTVDNIRETYLPLTAGSSKPLTGDLYIKNGTAERSIFLGNGAQFRTNSAGDLVLSSASGRGIFFRTASTTTSDGGMVLKEKALIPGLNLDTDLGATNVQWNNIYGKTIYQNGGQVANKNDLNAYLPLKGGNLSGHIYLTGAKSNSSTSNTSQIIFGTSNDNHVAISSNNNALVINPTATSTTNQIVLYLDTLSQFPSGINSTSTINGNILSVKNKVSLQYDSNTESLNFIFN